MSKNDNKCINHLTNLAPPFLKVVKYKFIINMY